MLSMTYDFEAHALYIYLNNSSQAVITQEVQAHHKQGMHVDIDGDGNVMGIEVLSPGSGPWPIQELLTRYPFDINTAYLLTVLAERYPLFNF